jgi:formylglycine-generating enzyme required for sulfatase activity
MLNKAILLFVIFCSVLTSAELVKPLQKGWNLVNFPVQSNVSGFENINSYLRAHLRPTNGQISDSTQLINKIWSYDGGWYGYSPSKPDSTLTSLKPGLGCWVLMEQEAVLFVDDSELSQTNVQISNPGWALVGFGNNKSFAFSKLYESIQNPHTENNMVKVWGFDGTWKGADVSNASKELTPLEGAWILLQNNESVLISEQTPFKIKLEEDSSYAFVIGGATDLFPTRDSVAGRSSGRNDVSESSCEDKDKDKDKKIGIAGLFSIDGFQFARKDVFCNFSDDGQVLPVDYELGLTSEQVDKFKRNGKLAENLVLSVELFDGRSSKSFFGKEFKEKLEKGEGSVDKKLDTTSSLSVAFAGVELAKRLGMTPEQITLGTSKSGLSDAGTQLRQVLGKSSLDIEKFSEGFGQFFDTDDEKFSNFFNRLKEVSKGELSENLEEYVKKAKDFDFDEIIDEIKKAAKNQFDLVSGSKEKLLSELLSKTDHKRFLEVTEVLRKTALDNATNSDVLELLNLGVNALEVFQEERYSRRLSSKNLSSVIKELDKALKKNQVIEPILYVELVDDMLHYPKELFEENIEKPEVVEFFGRCLNEVAKAALLKLDFIGSDQKESKKVVSLLEKLEERYFGDMDEIFNNALIRKSVLVGLLKQTAQKEVFEFALETLKQNELVSGSDFDWAELFSSSYKSNPNPAKLAQIILETLEVGSDVSSLLKAVITVVPVDELKAIIDSNELSARFGFGSWIFVNLGEDKVYKYGGTHFEFSLDASRSFDVFGQELTYRWFEINELGERQELDYDTSVVTVALDGLGDKITKSFEVEVSSGGRSAKDQITVELVPLLNPVILVVEELSVKPDEEFVFDASQSFDPEEIDPELDFSWRLPSGEVVNGAVLKGSYGQVGPYVIELSVSKVVLDEATGNELTAVAIKDVQVNVVRPLFPPIVDAGEHYTFEIGVVLNESAVLNNYSVSKVTGLTEHLRYRWTPIELFEDYTARIPKFIVSEAGDYAIELHVTEDIDGESLNASDMVTVSVVPGKAPVAKLYTQSKVRVDANQSYRLKLDARRSYSYATKTPEFKWTGSTALENMDQNVTYTTLNASDFENDTILNYCVEVIDYNGTTKACKDVSLVFSIPTTVTVVQDGVVLAGKTVYAYDEEGKYLRQAKKTGENGEALFSLGKNTYKFAYTHQGKKWWSTSSISGGGVTDIQVPQDTVVSVKYGDKYLGGKTVYCFDSENVYQKYAQRTGESGQALFSFESGEYKYRFSFNGRYFWSGLVGAKSSAEITVPATTTVKLEVAGGALEGQQIYAYDSDGNYLKYARKTDINGVARFNLLAGTYTFKYNYNGKYWWSNPVAIGEDASISVPGGTSVLLTNQSGEPVSGQNIYVYNSNDEYLKYSRKTNDNGIAIFSLNDGNYKFRYNFNGKYWWSKVVASGGQAKITVPGMTNVSLVHQGGYSIESQNIYVYNEAGEYQKYSRKTSNEGIASFTLPSGNYKFRYNFNGRYFWTDVVASGQTGTITVPVDTSISLISSSAPNVNQVIYVYDVDGNYLKHSRKTNEQGLAKFNLEDGAYKFRFTYNGKYWWSDVVYSGELGSIVVPENTLVEVLNRATGVHSGLSVASYSADEESLNYSRKTNQEGLAAFTLANGSYKFRYSFNGKYFWSDVVSAGAKTSIVVPSYTYVQVSKDGKPVASKTLYAYDRDGNYLKYSRKTDVNGFAYFSLGTGVYKFKCSDNGKYFWTEELASGTVGNIVLPSDTIVELYLDDEPLSSGHTIYAFTQEDSSANYSRKTDDSGVARFTISGGTYKFRYKFGDKYFWSDLTAAGSKTKIFVDSGKPKTAPEQIEITPAQTKLLVKWSKVEKASLYKVIYCQENPQTITGRSLTRTDETESMVEVEGSSVELTDIDVTKQVSISVIPSNEQGDGPAANATFDGVVPPAVPVGLETEPMEQSVKITWAPNTDVVDNYLIYFSEGTPIKPISDSSYESTSSSFVVTGLKNGVRYYFAVAAENVSGSSAISNTVWEVPVTTSRATTLLAASATFPTWSDDGQYVAYMTGDFDTANMNLWVIRTDGTEKKLLAFNTYSHIEWDGDYVVYKSLVDGQFWKVKVDGSERTKVCEVELPSPYVSNVTIFNRQNSKYQIEKVGDSDDYVFSNSDSDGVTTNLYFSNNYNVSRIGSLRSYLGFEVLNAESILAWDSTGLFKYDFATNTEETVATNLINFNNYSLSPSGKHVAMLLGGSQIGVLNLKERTAEGLASVNSLEKHYLGFNFEQGLPDYYHNVASVWSPNEKMVVFSSGTEHDRNLYVVEIETKNVYRLTFDEYKYWGASWSPDGQKIVAIRRAKSVINDSLNFQEVVVIDVSDLHPEVHTTFAGIKMLNVSGGSYMRGASSDDSDSNASEKPQHEVLITDDFFMGMMEISQKQWKSVMGEESLNQKISSTHPAYGDEFPMFNVSWDDIAGVDGFLDKLNTLSGCTVAFAQGGRYLPSNIGNGCFRLPTAAEWEYVAKAGSDSRFSWGDDLDYTQLNTNAWTFNNAENPNKSGKKPMNQWGFYDLSGNVGEWVYDWAGETYLSQTSENPAGALTGTTKLVKGGSYTSLTNSSYRASALGVSHTSDYFADDLGFRVVYVENSSQNVIPEITIFAHDNGVAIGSGYVVNTYDSIGTDLNINGLTNVDSTALFALTTGSYQFSVAVSGVRYFSSVVTAPSSVVIDIASAESVNDLVPVTPSTIQLHIEGEPAINDLVVWYWKASADLNKGIDSADGFALTNGTGIATFEGLSDEYIFGHWYQDGWTYSESVSTPVSAHVLNALPATRVCLVDTAGEAVLGENYMWYWLADENPNEVGAPASRRFNVDPGTGCISSSGLMAGSYVFGHYNKKQWYYSEIIRARTTGHIVVGSSSIRLVRDGQIVSDGAYLWYYREGEDPVELGAPASRRGFVEPDSGVADFMLGEGNYFVGYFYKNAWYYSNVFEAPFDVDFNVNFTRIALVDVYNQKLEGANYLWYWTEHEEPTVVGAPSSRRRPIEQDGLGIFNLTDGNYKFGTYLDGNWFYTSNVASGETTSLVAGHTPVKVSINDVPLSEGGYVWYYSVGEDPVVIGAPSSRRSRLDKNGIGNFNLKQSEYFFGCIYDGVWYYSAPVFTPTTVDFNIELTKIKLVDANGNNFSGNNYVWYWLEGEDPSEVGALSSRRVLADSESVATFNLDKGNYVFGHYYDNNWFMTSAVSSGSTTSLTIGLNYVAVVVDGTNVTGESNYVWYYLEGEEPDVVGAPSKRRIKLDPATGIGKVVLKEGNYFFGYLFEGDWYYSDVMTAPFSDELRINSTKILLHNHSGNSFEGINYVWYWLEGEDPVTVGAPSSRRAIVNQNGEAVFNLPKGLYQFGHHRDSHWYYTSVVSSGLTTALTAGKSSFEVSFNGVVLTEGNSYIWYYQKDEIPSEIGAPRDRRVLVGVDGSAQVSLPKGEYFFGYLYKNVWHYSEVVETPSFSQIHFNLTEISMVNVLGEPFAEGEYVWYWNENEVPAEFGAPSYRRSSLDNNGRASFNLETGNYIFGSYQNGKWYYTPVVSSGSSYTLTAGVSSVRPLVEGVPIEGAQYLWYYKEGENPSEIGAPSYRRGKTEMDSGQANFALGRGRYFFGIFYGGVWYYSKVVEGPFALDFDIDFTKIKLVDQSGALLTGNNYVWYWHSSENPDEVGALSSRRALVDSETGIAKFNLPQGDYTFGTYKFGKWHRILNVSSQGEEQFLFVSND